MTDSPSMSSWRAMYFPVYPKAPVTAFMEFSFSVSALTESEGEEVSTLVQREAALRLRHPPCERIRGRNRPVRSAQARYSSPNFCSISASSLGTREIISTVYPVSHASPIAQFADTRKNEIRMM